MLEAIKDQSCGWFYRANSEGFEVIPGKPIAYWLSQATKEVFSREVSLGEKSGFKRGMATGDNDKFIRFWHELGVSETSIPNNSTSNRWHKYNKGGDFRRWYGNQEQVVFWENDGKAIKTFTDGKGKLRSRPQNVQYAYQPSVSYSSLTSGIPSIHVFEGFIHDQAGNFCPLQKSEVPEVAGLLNSKTAAQFLRIFNATMNILTSDLNNIPLLPRQPTEIKTNAEHLISLARSDWDAYETSWDFTTLPLLSPDHRAETLEDSYVTLRVHWQGMTEGMQRLEEENNRIFIDAYGLQDELTPEVPIEEITLTCNPAYRYGVKGAEEDRETRLRADTMAEFLSYAVGCMFGRYSLDAPGLILANQGETLADYLSRVPDPSFLPDEDNVIPVLEADWFADDIVDRFRKFLRVTFGEAHFRENLAFIEAQIGDIRKYFTKGFYDDHVKRYKKRPIYWMFYSPKGTFQALIYMHRYRPDTVSVLLNDYLREFIRKLEAERARLEKLSDDPAATQTQRTKALKDVGVIAKQLAELEEWEREVIFPLAQAKIEIDLDDGVKRNYPLFGLTLKPINGLEAADE